MTFANIQQISVRQGPLQRLLGIADVEVHTAGGGSPDEGGGGMHTGYFRGVADAEAIRNTIRDRVREYRDAGLGDDALPAAPGRRDPPPSGRPASRVAPHGRLAPTPESAGSALSAARSVLEEARALRAAVKGGG